MRRTPDPDSQDKPLHLPDKRRGAAIFSSLGLLVLFLAGALGPLPATAAPPEKPRQKFSVRCVKIITRDECGDQLNYPASLYYDRYSEEVFVGCSGARQLVVFSEDFYPLVSVGRGRGVNAVRGCGSSPETIYLCSKTMTGDRQDPEKGIILTLNRALLPTGVIELINLPGKGDFFPTRARPVGDRLYLIGSGRDGLMITDLKGNFESKIAPVLKVLGVPEKATLQAFTFDRQNRLYLLSENLGTIFVFSPDGEFLFRFGEKGGSSGKLSRPRGIAILDRLGLVFVVDYMRHAVNVYNLDGDYLFEIGGQGTRNGWFSFPSDVCIDGRGRLWVADTFNQRLQVFTCRAAEPAADDLPTEEIEGEPGENEIQNFPTEEGPESDGAGDKTDREKNPDCAKRPS